MTDIPAPKTLREWTARRAGGRITVHGVDISTNTPTKITNVDTITPPSDHSLHEVLATDVRGTVHRLIFA